ncbi:hypothetical protein [Oceanobacter mangrovi]|uniref:hypothetical protein n=1 Tax=Oceanobacter mangrovi TaxID=2862510 RepID=UPI001C8D8B85|nr:hypothetical protein [Oceanobacter mangrovi]
MAGLFVLVSCPERRYQFPFRLHSPADINQALSQAALKYRTSSWPEQARLNQWMLDRLEDRQGLILASRQDQDAVRALRDARELLLTEGSLQLGIRPLSGSLAISVGIESGPDSYFLDVERFPLPFKPLTSVRAAELWRRMETLEETFAGIQIQR